MVRFSRVWRCRILLYTAPSVAAHQAHGALRGAHGCQAGGFGVGAQEQVAREQRFHHRLPAAAAQHAALQARQQAFEALAPQGRAHLRAYARDIGLAFQIADDLLDVEGDIEKAGKALRKDDTQGKQTFVTLMGAEKAREQARALVDQAVLRLASYGSEADILRALARYIVERDR